MKNQSNGYVVSSVTNITSEMRAKSKIVQSSWTKNRMSPKMSTPKQRHQQQQRQYRSNGTSHTTQSQKGVCRKVRCVFAIYISLIGKAHNVVLCQLSRVRERERERVEYQDREERCFEIKKIYKSHCVFFTRLFRVQHWGNWTFRNSYLYHPFYSITYCSDYNKPLDDHHIRSGDHKIYAHYFCFL